MCPTNFNDFLLRRSFAFWALNGKKGKEKRRICIQEYKEKKTE
jgi:hypothetical protein